MGFLKQEYYLDADLKARRSGQAVHRSGHPLYNYAACPTRLGIDRQVYSCSKSHSSFGQSVLGAVILLRHAHLQTGLLHHLDVGVRRILAPTVRVVDRSLAWLEPSQRHGQGF